MLSVIPSRCSGLTRSAKHWKMKRAGRVTALKTDGTVMSRFGIETYFFRQFSLWSISWQELHLTQFHSPQKMGMS